MADSVSEHAGLTKGARITGDQRSSLGQTFGERYAAGESIRSIAMDTGRSYGFVHGVLKESGASLRGRGGATRGPRRGTAAQAVAIVDEGTASPTLTKAKKIVDKAAEKAGKAKSTKDDKGKKKAEAKKTSKKGKKG